MSKYTKEQKQFLEKLGNRIRYVRGVKAMTQPHVAALCDSEKSHLSRIETGKVNPTINTIKSIADILKVSIAELFVA